MLERTEAQKLFQEPVKVMLGGKEYEIKPLVLKESAPWRKEFVGLFKDISKLASITSDDPEAFNQAMNEILLGKPEELMNLFFKYTKFDRNEIEGSATSKEIMAAFEEVIALEAPFFGSAIRMMVKLQKTVL